MTSIVRKELASLLGVDLYKMVLVVRTDLDMGKGKMCAQCGHATLSAYKAAVSSASAKKRGMLQAWEENGQAKVVVKVKSEAELLDIYDKASMKGITAEYVRDAGHTQVAPGSVTVLALGPDEATTLDKVTGHLKLL